MISVTHNYAPNDTVWHLTTRSGIKEGTVTKVYISVTSTSTVITYNVRYKDGSPSAEINEAELYMTVNDALAAYEIQLTA